MDGMELQYYIDALRKDPAVLLTAIDKLGFLLTSQDAEKRIEGLTCMNQMVHGAGPALQDQGRTLFESTKT